MSRPAIATALAATALLSACGGGDSSPENTAPVLLAQTFTGTEDISLAGLVLAQDPGDTLTLAVVGNPASGTLTGFSSNGAFAYLPNRNFNGTDTFSVRATDSKGLTATATMTLVVAAVNDPPVAAHDEFTMNSSGSIAVTANDSDPEGGALTVSLLGPAFAGTATVNVDNTVNLQLPAGFKGFTVFTYRITDAGGATAQAVAIGYIGISPFNVVNVRPATAITGPGLFLSTLISERRIGDPQAAARPGDRVRFADNGRALAFEQATPLANTALYYADLNSTAPPRLAEDRADADRYVTNFVVGPAGRYVAYVFLTGQLLTGSELRLFDATMPGVGERISKPINEQPQVASPMFDAAGTYVYYSGNGLQSWPWDNGGYRVNLASRALTRVTPILPESIYSLISPPPAGDQRLVYFRYDLHQVPNGEPIRTSTMFANDLSAPSVSIPLIEPLAADEQASSPNLFTADGNYVGATIYRMAPNDDRLNNPQRVIIARPHSPGTSMQVGGPGFGVVSLMSAAGVRADSQAALASHCSGGVCNLSEFSLANPTTLVPVASAATAGDVLEDGRYSEDGERIVYLRKRNNGATSRLEVTHRGAFGQSIPLTPDNRVVNSYELDPSGCVAAVSFSDGTSTKLLLVNLDVPLRMLQVGDDVARAKTFEVLPR